MRIFFAACSSQDTGPCYFALRALLGATEKMPNNNNIFCSVSSWPDTDLLNCQAYAHCGLLCAVSTKYRDQARTLMRGRERWLVVTSCARSRVRRVSSSCATQHYKQINPPSQHEHAVQEAVAVMTRSLIVLFMVMAKLLLFHRIAVSPLSHTRTRTKTRGVPVKLLAIRSLDIPSPSLVPGRRWRMIVVRVPSESFIMWSPLVTCHQMKAVMCPGQHRGHLHCRHLTFISSFTSILIMEKK